VGEIGNAPNIYAPNFSPTESTASVTDEQVKQTAERQEKRLSDMFSVQHRKVVCPYCFGEFEVD
jgi:hypothetical protein